MLCAQSSVLQLIRKWIESWHSDNYCAFIRYFNTCTECSVHKVLCTECIQCDDDYLLLLFSMIVVSFDTHFKSLFSWNCLNLPEAFSLSGESYSKFYFRRFSVKSLQHLVFLWCLSYISIFNEYIFVILNIFYAIWVCYVVRHTNQLFTRKVYELVVCVKISSNCRSQRLDLHTYTIFSNTTVVY